MREREGEGEDKLSVVSDAALLGNSVDSSDLSETVASQSHEGEDGEEQQGQPVLPEHANHNGCQEGGVPLHQDAEIVTNGLMNASHSTGTERGRVGGRR